MGLQYNISKTVRRLKTYTDWIEEHHTWVGGPIMGSGSFIPEFTNVIVDPETGLGGHPVR